MTSQSDDAQGGLFDFTVINAELAEACATIAKHALAMKEVNAAKRLRKEQVQAMQQRIEDEPGFEEGGVRMRVRKDENDPGYVLKVGARSGGGFQVEEWHGVGVFSQAKVE